MRSHVLVALVLVLPVALVAHAAPARSSWSVGENVFSIPLADGTIIDATAVVPSAAAPPAGFPAVVVIHGYGGSKDVGTAHTLADHGYVGFAYSTPGFGESTGKMDVAGPASMEALKELIVWLKANGPVDATKVAVTGASYGGGHSLQAAAMDDMGIATAIPIVPWSDLKQALEPNGVVKLSYVGGFYATGNGLVQSGSKPIEYDLFGQEVGRRQLYDTYDPQVHEGFAALMAGVGGSDVDAFLAERSAIYAADHVHIPILIIQGFDDDLFPADQALTMFHAMRNAPAKALYLGYLGHPRALNDPIETQYALAKVLAWLDYYLKGVGPQPWRADAPIEVANEPALVNAGLAPRSLNLTDWPVSGSGTRLFFDGSATLARSPPASGLPAVLVDDHAAGLQDDAPANAVAGFTPNVPDSTAADTLNSSLTLAGGATLLGTPRAELYVTPTAPTFEIAVKIFDRAPSGSETLVTKGIFGASDAIPGVELPVRFDLDPYHHAFAPGHALEVRVALSDFPSYRPVDVPAPAAITLGGAHASAIVVPLS
ncbi:MAG: CocE/NonD family hydrolase [Thermoplasmatota archaeon]